MINKAIWCYAEGKLNNWEAFCLDFDLSVQGKSFDQVYRDLNKSISMYLEYIKGLPEEEQAQFLTRKTPVGLRLKFILGFLFSVFFDNGNNNEKDRAGFLVHYQA